MNTSDLAVLILVSTVAYFVVSRLARRPGKEAPILIFMSRIMAVFVLGLTIFYFYIRFAA